MYDNALLLLFLQINFHTIIARKSKRIDTVK